MVSEMYKMYKRLSAPEGEHFLWGDVREGPAKRDGM